MTAYATPPTYVHGYFPVASVLNKYSQGITHIEERAASVQRNPCTRQLGNGERVYFTHKDRYLHYKSSGQLIDVAGIEDDIALPNTSDDFANVYDLDQVAWLAYGSGYWVQGVTFAMELDDPAVG